MKRCRIGWHKTIAFDNIGVPAPVMFAINRILDLGYQVGTGTKSSLWANLSHGTVASNTVSLFSVPIGGVTPTSANCGVQPMKIWNRRPSARSWLRTQTV